MAPSPARTDHEPDGQVDHEELGRPQVKGRLLAVVQDWRATREGTKVILIILAAVFLAWAAFVLWFWMTFEF
jgi:hypothetical protein